MWLFDSFKHHFVPGPANAYQPKILHRPWLVFFFVIILATEGFLVSNLIARQSSQNFLAAVVPAEIIALTNTERASNNVDMLQDDALLDKAAQAKADDMAAKGYFAHIGPDGKTPWQWISEAGYHYQYAGENLAVRFIDSADVVNAWMASPTHRANIVKPVYTEIGVGVAQGMFEGESATYVVQYFGTPQGVVEGASVEAAAPQSGVSVPLNNFTSYTQSFFRQVMRVFAEPERASNIVLGLCAIILIIAIALTFFVHLQVQPANLLMGGAFVALFALSLLGINTLLTGGGGGPNASQAASPLETSRSAGIVIDSGAASTGYALFPQL
ncbi:MAG TPA: CAP domain-containing protein [Candidatus Paceibacterota bacterium]